MTTRDETEPPPVRGWAAIAMLNLRCAVVLLVVNVGLGVALALVARTGFPVTVAFYAPLGFAVAGHWPQEYLILTDCLVLPVHAQDDQDQLVPYVQIRRNNALFAIHHRPVVVRAVSVIVHARSRIERTR